MGASKEDRDRLNAMALARVAGVVSRPSVEPAKVAMAAIEAKAPKHRAEVVPGPTSAPVEPDLAAKLFAQHEAKKARMRKYMKAYLPGWRERKKAKSKGEA
jgi:hypothetical protein